MMWCISEAQGNACIHAGRLLEGVPMMWEDLRLSERGRWWMGVLERHARRQRGRGRAS